MIWAQNNTLHKDNALTRATTELPKLILVSFIRKNNSKYISLILLNVETEISSDSV